MPCQCALGGHAIDLGNRSGSKNPVLGYCAPAIILTSAHLPDEWLFPAACPVAHAHAATMRSAVRHLQPAVRHCSLRSATATVCHGPATAASPWLSR
eukprot:1653131-Pyramimonas_sp.AAC.1